MSRNERITVAAVFGVAAGFVSTLAFGIADRLNGHTWFGAGGNEIQWVSGIGLGLAIATGLAMHLARTCAASTWCLRRGEHPVDGTLEKVCSRHHTMAAHRKVFAERGPAHAASGRLDLGQSHGATT